MKKIALMLTIFLVLCIFASCEASTAAVPGEVIAPYGIEDRLIGCWVEQKGEKPFAENSFDDSDVMEGDELREEAVSQEGFVLQFLPNGRVFQKNESISNRGVSSWYTVQGQVLTFEGVVGTTLFGRVGLVKYSFEDDDTFTLTYNTFSDCITYTFVRTEEHFVDIGY